MAQTAKTFAQTYTEISKNIPPRSVHALCAGLSTGLEPYEVKSYFGNTALGDLIEAGAVLEDGSDWDTESEAVQIAMQVHGPGSEDSGGASLGKDWGESKEERKEKERTKEKEKREESYNGSTKSNNLTTLDSSLNGSNNPSVVSPSVQGKSDRAAFDTGEVLEWLKDSPESSRYSERPAKDEVLRNDYFRSVRQVNVTDVKDAFAQVRGDVTGQARILAEVYHVLFDPNYDGTEFTDTLGHSPIRSPMARMIRDFAEMTRLSGHLQVFMRLKDLNAKVSAGEFRITRQNSALKYLLGILKKNRQQSYEHTSRRSLQQA